MDCRAVFVAPGVLRLLINRDPGFDVDERVYVSIERERSPRSHRHQFAWIADAWASLPEHLMGMPWAETPETLRKQALIETGFHQVFILDCGRKATAQRVKAALLAAEVKAHGYAIGQVRGPVVTIWTPESQSIRAMGGDRFKASKSAILDWIAGKLGVSPEDLRRAAA